MNKQEYLTIIKRLILAFSFYPLIRLAFLITNNDYFSSIEWSEVLKAFLYGFRFDLSTVLIANSIFIILSVIPFRHKLYQLLLKSVFVCFNGAFLIINIIDL